MMSPREGLSFNVLVSDIGLPGMDGYELMQHIRKDLKVPATRLAPVAVTAFGRNEDRQRAFDAGFQSHLTKPYEVAHLVAALRKLEGDVADSARVSANPHN